MLHHVPVTYGADPEFFAQRDGKVIGSERLIPEQGLRKTAYTPPLVIRDGVQIELNPPGSGNVPALANQISSAFRLLRAQMQPFPSVSLNWDGLVEVTREELDALSPASRLLGCQPSENVYGPKPITVDPVNYRKRSAGGHLHFGLKMSPRLFAECRNAVPLLDIFVGNTCVLLDRDPGQAERRKNYGRAGEFRFQRHGLEYRTLSNFWLRHYALMSFVFGMADIALSVLNQGLMGNDIEQELISTINIDHIIKAIDTNDYDLARANFEVIRPFLAKHLPDVGFCMNVGQIEKFLRFAEGVRAKGLSAFFPQVPEVVWTRDNRVEFSTFLASL